MKRISQHKARGPSGKAKTFRIDRTLDADLKRAGEDRYAKGRWPNTDSGILTLALEEWLEREGYTRGEERKAQRLVPVGPQKGKGYNLAITPQTVEAQARLEQELLEKPRQEEVAAIQWRA